MSETQPFIDGLTREGIGCVVWPFARNAAGYGILYRDGQCRLAHRYICEKFHGAPPTPEHDAAHSCGRGFDACIAPWHLEWKTRAENLEDRVLHGTSNRGERCGTSILTEPEAREIKRRLKMGERNKDIADDFDIDPSLVSHIRHERAWAWLEDN